MTYEVALLTFGVALILLGLIGKVKIKEIDLGSNSSVVRITAGSIGIIFILLSFNPSAITNKLTSSSTPSTDNQLSTQFQGSYKGDFTGSAYPNGISIHTQIKQVGEKTVGKYSYGMKEGTLEGYIDKDTLYFQWHESGAYGKGKYHFKESGKRFTGTWGYKESDDNGGTWYGQKD